MAEIKSKSYTLRDERGNWVGQVVLTADGMFASVTDYGNLGYAWRAYGEADFRTFMVSIDEEYFATKLYTGVAYLAYGRKYEQACRRFAQKVLPPLQAILKEELTNNTPW